jgi:malonate-semialdehyde dehydrogenase (acetylating)/methylmalonate-semialdehyde dehydrogenase
MVGINVAIPVPINSHPFGGWKRSVFGNSCLHGQDSVYFYTKNKTITLKWPEHNNQDSTFSMPTHR